ncbi:hypothetical protein HN954_03885 [bacterium]|nr:hypothetical protein [bacterium]MBT6831717.1 hypothetical protein [bacterium]MBT6996540.1 hypothetical protein [bacterium]MBT7772866.1 hypothetical protein [bacterium]
MKRWIFLLLPLIFLAKTASAADVPRTINLIFDDRTLTLDFQIQNKLIRRVPQHFLVWNEQRIPIDLRNSLPPEDAFLEVETKFVPKISPEKLHLFLEEISIFRTETSRAVEIQLDEKENVLFEGSPHDGYEIDFEKLVHLLDAAIENHVRDVRVPARKIFSQVIVDPNLATRGILEVIAIGESNFTGSSDARRQNILAGAKLFNGKIVPQGEIFSFNKILESVSEEKGFVRELVIKGDKTEKELGGGLCQVSTTVFRAAFSGGFPIPVRRNHSYAVPYYKPFGLDATIYLGGQDFRFENDSPSDLLIQTFVENDDLFFVFYGTNDDRKISFEGPFISEFKSAPDPIVYKTEDLPAGEMFVFDQAHDGFRAEWIRRVKKNGNSWLDNFISVYRPWPAKIQVGTKKN